MSIVINKSKCVGCGQCSIVCPGSLIKMGEDRKAYKIGRASCRERV